MIQGGGPFPYNFDVQIALPADAREFCENLSDLTNAAKWRAKDGNMYLWKGMRTYVRETGSWYELISEPSGFSSLSNWKQLGEGSGSKQSDPEEWVDLEENAN